MQVKRTFFAIIVSLLTACAQTTMAPVEQVQMGMATKSTQEVLPTTRIVKRQMTLQYRCEKGKTVRVQRSASSPQNSIITVSFNQTSYKLSPVITKKGKKYSNIRWTWLEDMNDKGTLQDNRNTILAKNCVKK